MSHPPSPVRLPSGVRDFLPRAAARRRGIAERLLAAFEAWGYQRIVTPVFECADVLERGLGADARAAAIRFVEPGTGEVVALRPDITPQVARLAATRLAEVEGALRLCYEGAVNRLSSPGRGPLAQREILQAGVELIGADDVAAADAEALAVAAAALAAIDPGPDAGALVDVGHVAPVRWVLDGVGEARAAVAAALARKDRAAVARAVSAAPADVAAAAVALVGLTGPLADVLARARALAWPAHVAAALAALEAAVAAARELAPAVRVTADLGELRGFDYYTGLRFAGYLRGAGDAVLRGGRYDELVGRYGRAARAVGFAVDIEAVALAQRARQLAPPAPPPGVLVTGERHAAAAIARALRAAGLRAAIDLATARADRLRYAAETGWTHVLSLDPAALTAVADGASAPISPEVIAHAVGGDARAILPMLPPFATDAARAVGARTTSAPG